MSNEMTLPFNHSSLAFEKTGAVVENLPQRWCNRACFGTYFSAPSASVKLIGFVRWEVEESCGGSGVGCWLGAEDSCRTEISRVLT